MELSKALRDHSKTIKGKQQLIMSSYAKALEIIPRQLVRERERESIVCLHLWQYESYKIEVGLCRSSLSAPPPCWESFVRREGISWGGCC